MYESSFPRGIATGSAFCNRKAERKRLAQNIQSGQHTLLMSPRRYGKTSLVRYAIEESGFHFGEADLFVAVDAKRVEQRILSGIKMILNNIGAPIENTLKLIRDYFKKTNSKWVIGTQGVSIELIPSQENDPASNIMDALLALENLLAQKKKRAVLFLDEVQEMGEVAEGKGIEGAIRHAAQESQCLSLIFSGSSRRLLGKMFFDKTRPLYKLCDRINLTRITKIDYKKHLNKLALKRWGDNLPELSIDKILNLTEQHPYYVNNLCLRLWESALESPPAIEEIESYWHHFVKEERLETARELSSLSIGQRKVLIAIASGRNKNLTGKKALNIINLTSSSTLEALNVLEQKDYIERHDHEYSIIDPLIKTSLNLYFGES